MSRALIDAIVAEADLLLQVMHLIETQIESVGDANPHSSFSDVDHALEH